MMHPVIPVIVQARSSSRRLPGKVTMPLAGRPMLARQVERLRRCTLASEIIVATSSGADDDVVEALARRAGCACFRGALDDVAKRLIDLCDARGAVAFVRVSGDSPFLDPALVDAMIATFIAVPCDVASNVKERTFPKGQSVEVVSVAALRSAYPRMDESDREHVTPLFYRPGEGFRVAGLSSGGAWGEVQLSVDTAEDFRMAETLCHELGPAIDSLGWLDIAQRCLSLGKP